MCFINLIKKRGQISAEYLVILGFLTFVIIGTLGIAMTYSASLKDQIKMNQLEGFSKKIISSSETIFYSGSPAKTTITAYLPEGMKELNIQNKEIISIIETNTGENTRSFISKVNLTGSISTISGLKRITISAQDNGVEITEG